MISTFDHSRYVPCLRWKQGEYQALFRLNKATKGAITPLVEVPEIGWDFENSQDSKTIDEHLKKLPDRLITKWGERDFFLDCKLVETESMMDRTDPTEWIHTRLGALKNHVCHVASLSTSSSAAHAILNIVASTGCLALRLTLSDFAKGNLQARITNFLGAFGVTHRQCHLILDIEAPNFEPIDGFGKMLSLIASQIPFLDQWATFTLIGTSFPESMGAVCRGAHEIPRHEWAIYKAILSHEIPFKRIPTFGDYCIAHPGVVAGDMRLVKPAASIRYTISDRWLLIKGSAFRENPTQVCTFSKNLVASPYFMGNSFSLADEHIAKCAQGSQGPGNLSTWRWVGTNHHIEKVARDLANLSDLAAGA